MANAYDAIDEVRQALRDHFGRSAQQLRVPQIMEITALDEPAVTNALAVLHNNGEIEGALVAELDHPMIVAGFRTRRFA